MGDLGSRLPLSYLATPRAELQRPIFGAKLEAWRHKMLHIFYFLQSDTVLGSVNPFREYSWPSPVGKIA